MFPLAHVGFTLLAVELLSFRVPRLRAVHPAWIAGGALLPDLVDKPLAFLVLRNNHTHLVGHGLLFVVILAVVAWLLRAQPRRAPVGVALAMGSSVHLLLDRMWQEPATLLWPGLGWGFPAVERGVEPYLLDYLRAWRDWLPMEALGALSLVAAIHLRQRVLTKP